nr:transcription initiation factor TFIID subunit 11-like [Ipomoea batatas]
MAVSGSDYRVKRARENSDYFPFDCSKLKYKRRNVSARRDFPKGIVQFVSEPEELEAMGSGNPVGFYQGSSVKSNHVVKGKSESEPEELGAVESGVLSEPIHELPEEIVVARRKVYARRDFPEAFYVNSSRFVKVDREESESEPEELEEIGSDHDPEAFYANSSHFVKVDREESESEPEELEAIDSDDDPEGFFASCSQFMKVDREETESDPEELEAINSVDNPKAFRANVDREETESDPEELKAIDSDDDLATTNPNHVADLEKTEITCELEEIDGSSNPKPICSADKMEPEIPKDTQNQEPVNQVVGSTEPLDSSSTQGAGEKRGDYIQHLLASLDQLAATLMQMKQQGAFKKKSAA